MLSAQNEVFFYLSFQASEIFQIFVSVLGFVKHSREVLLHACQYYFIYCGIYHNDFNEYTTKPSRIAKERKILGCLSCLSPIQRLRADFVLFLVTFVRTGEYKILKIK